MSYPERLLPKPHYKRIIWNEDLRNHFLIHFTQTKDIRDPKTKNLKVECVVRQTDHLRDYSNNLLGVFLVDDIFWEASDCPRKAYFNADWESGSTVDQPEVPLEYKRNENRGYFFLKADDCHNRVVQFEDSTGVNPVCKILHTPTNSNFWHFSLRWFFDGKEMPHWPDGVKRRMKLSARAFIVDRAFFDEPAYHEIDTATYTIP